MRKQADVLDKIDEETIVGTYVARSGQDKQKIIDMLSEETWMTADEAKHYGFIDGITDEIKMAAYYDLDRFDNVPDQLTVAMQAILDPARPLSDARKEKIAKINVALKKRKL